MCVCVCVCVCVTVSVYVCMCVTVYDEKVCCACGIVLRVSVLEWRTCMRARMGTECELDSHGHARKSRERARRNETGKQAARKMSVVARFILKWGLTWQKVVKWWWWWRGSTRNVAWSSRECGGPADLWVTKTN